MSKAIKQTLAALNSRQAVVIGKEAPAKVPAGAVLLTFGKTYALQRESSDVVDALPPKIAAAVKVLVETGGVITAKVAKAAGIDFSALIAKLQGNKSVTLTEKGKTKFSVTPRAKRADLINVGEQPAAPAPKGKTAAKAQTKAPAKPVKGGKAKAIEAAKTARAKVDAKKAKEAPKATKGTKVAKAPVKAASKPAKAPAAKGKAKAAPAPAKAKGKPAAKPAKAAPKATVKKGAEKPAKGKAAKAVPAKTGKAKKAR